MRISLVQLRVIASSILLAAGTLCAHWVVTARGPYAHFLALELGESPASHPLAAACCTFLVTMAPGLVVVVGLAWRSPLAAELGSLRLADVRRELAARAGAGHRHETDRVARAVGVAAGGGWLGAALRSGQFEDVCAHAPLGPVVAAAAAFGVAAACWYGRSWGERGAFCVPLVAVAVGTLPPLEWYLTARPDALTFELLLPVAIGAWPGCLAFWAVSRWRLRRPGPSRGARPVALARPRGSRRHRTTPRPAR